MDPTDGGCRSALGSQGSRTGPPEHVACWLRDASETRPWTPGAAGDPAPLEQVVEAADRLQAGTSFTPEFERALLPGSTLGGARPKSLRELFGRVVFTILVGNTDDHPRNHAAFWDGREASLTPAHDVCPQPRTGGEAALAMATDRDGSRLARLDVARSAADVYPLDEHHG